MTSGVQCDKIHVRLVLFGCQKPASNGGLVWVFFMPVGFVGIFLVPLKYFARLDTGHHRSSR
jgi:hypothetical protein